MRRTQRRYSQESEAEEENNIKIEKIFVIISIRVSLRDIRVYSERAGCWLFA